MSPNPTINTAFLQSACREFVEQGTTADAAHDILHIMRVVKNTIYLTDIEKANSLVTLPAAWLHDCVAVPKDSPLRHQGSRLAAAEAVKFLGRQDYPETLLDEVYHAIESHSYSASIPTRSLEAAVIQDADGLDSLGAIGIARCLMVGGKLDRPLCQAEDPFCEDRKPDDSLYTIDHFYSKLFKLPQTMQTQAGRKEAERRVDLMREYLDNLRGELRMSCTHW